MHAIPLDEVEPAKEIVKRFCTGAMSLGSISREAHETLAIAMNRLGGRSNTGEGGEDPARFEPDKNGDRRRSAIKQVASGRFGVTIHYLVNADELQIKMAQGAKPGEGGQLPGHKVDEYIGSIRHTTPGVGLISPPPHHDIYSIEDLKQLIYDLRCANPQAQVSVKLVSEVGVGTVAAGVSKANADRVLIAGHDGGTGASPLSSIQSAGVPWEIGLAETQQTLLLNDLRSRIVVQTDGQLKTGRDVVIAAMLGADEMGFSTGPLIATGCIMMRACHLNTCPVGIATQDPELRKRFKGTPEHVVNFFFFVAEEVREILASLGLRSLDEAIGRVDLLGTTRGDRSLEGARRRPDPRAAVRRDHRGRTAPARGSAPGGARGRARLAAGRAGAPLLECGGSDIAGTVSQAERPGPEQVRIELPIRNRNRCVGGILSSHIARACGAEGLPADSIVVDFAGSAGQSFGGWLAPGVDFTLRGDANDYAGKGLSGGVLSVSPRAGMGEHFIAEQNVIVGNTVLYGATAGQGVLPRPGGRALRGAQLGRERGGRGRGRSLLRVHDRRPGGRARADRTQLRGGDERRRRLCARRAGQPSRSAATWAWSASTSSTEADAIELRALIEEHGRRTGSPVAARVLADWDGLLERGAFVKVMPHDYKRVLRELAEQAEGEWPPDGQARGLSADRAPAGSPSGTRASARTTTRSSSCTRPVEELREQGGRCMDCGVPFCHNGCPLGNLIPDWNDLVYHDRFEDAIVELHATNNFPEFTGRLCPAPCEAACVLEIREGDAVTIKQIEHAIIGRAWEEGWVTPAAAAARDRAGGRRRRSGPAGMAAAQQLRRAGHRVTLFERDEAAGGLVRFGVPDFKIEKTVVQRRVEQLIAEGVELRCGVEVGRDVTVEELRASFDAVVLATGSRVPRDLPVPGRELDGVHFAMDYLYQRNRWVAREFGPEPSRRASPLPRATITAKDKDVVVIGGGDTGADCVGNALREGARSIVQLELLPEPPPQRPDDRTPWPEWPQKYRLSYAMEEAKELDLGEQDYSVTTVRFADDRRRRRRVAADRPGRARAAIRAGAGHRERAARAARAARDGLPGTRAGAARPARRGEGPARKRQGDQALHDVGRRRVRRRRCSPRTVADRVGDQRGPPVRADGRSLLGGKLNGGARRGSARGRRPGRPRGCR